jgi:hypothetical protein
LISFFAALLEQMVEDIRSQLPEEAGDDMRGLKDKAGGIWSFWMMLVRE